MKFFSAFSDLELDIVGIVAILGEGSASRNAQASALSWHHVLPRLYPAPQALLKPTQEKKLPVEKGVVVGAMSGRIRTELNFFTQLLHPDELPEYSVQMVEVTRKEHKHQKDVEGGWLGKKSNKIPPAFEAQKSGMLTLLSLLGCSMAIGLLGLSIWQDDGPAMLATILLATTSSLVGLASWSILDVHEEVPAAERTKLVPFGDVVIYYPRTGAFRVVRCTDKVSRLYFRIEVCKHWLGDNTYRAIALFATVTLMGGLVMLGNSQPVLQAAFAASYIALNALYWTFSALDPAKHVWKHDFVIKEFGFTKRMVRDSDGRIVPQESELSPPQGDFKFIESKVVIPMDLRSVQYYSNRHWTDSVPYHSTGHYESLTKRTPTVHSLNIQTGDELHKTNTANASILGDFFRQFKHRRTGTEPPSPVSNAPNSITGTALATSSALKPRDAQRQKLAAEDIPKRTMTSALWTVIALTGTAQWARSTNIAPRNAVWKHWLDEAERRAAARKSAKTGNYVPACLIWFDEASKVWIELPVWSYQKRLSDLFRNQSDDTRNRFENPTTLAKLQNMLTLEAVITLRVYCQRWRNKRRAALDRKVAATRASSSVVAK